MRGLVTGAMTLALAAPAVAQQDVPTIPVAPLRTAPAAPAQIEDVLVTARRRSERALDVPISLSVLDGQALGDAGLTLPTDIQERVPGLVVSVPNARLTTYTIRGLGSSSANDGIESSVGLFLDGVYLGRQGLSIFDLIDLDRVEVLRGPQGTLFGKNTTAGAISIVTQAPTAGFEAKAEATAGNLGARNLRGSINDSLGFGDLDGRLSGYLTRRDGTLANRFDGGTLNDRDKRGLRGQLLWTPAERLTGRFIAEYGDVHEACCAFPLRAPVREPVQARDDFMEYDRVGTNTLERRTDSDAPTRSDMRQSALSGELNWDLADDQRLTSITAARDWWFLPLNDDATSLSLASTSTLNQHRQYSQELRLASHFDAFDSVVGLFYIHQHLRGLEQVILGHDVVGWVFGGLIRERAPFATESNTGPALYLLIPPESLDGLTVDTRYRQRSDSASGFGSIDWHLLERVELTTGLRYTYEWKHGVVERHRYGGNPSASPLSAADPIGPLIDDHLPVLGDALEQAVGTDATGLTFNGILDDVAGGEYGRDVTLSEGNWSGQVALRYKLAADANLYGSVARGYKGGGTNLGFVQAENSPTFRPEQATSFELGAKAQLFERALSLGFAVYDTRVQDYQALTFDSEPTLLGNPRQINLLNVGKVRLRGAEAETYGFAAPGLMFRLGVAYSRAVTTEFPNAPNEDTRANDRNLSGETLYNAPRWSGNVGAEYQFPLGTSELFAAVDWSYKSGYWGTVEHGRASWIDGHGLANARAGWRATDRRWDVSAWVRNLADADYIATVYPLYGVGDYGAIPSDPRTFGMTLRMEFR